MDGIFLIACASAPPAQEPAPAPEATDSAVPSVDLSSYVETSRDETTYLAVNYVASTWTLSEDAEDLYQDIEGNPPTFELYAPKDATGPVPTVVWFHGGAFGDDADGSIPIGCGAEDVEGMIQGAVGTISLVIPWMASRGWAVLLPHNGWCDGWVGQGPTDPVDPEHHFGYYHVARVLDFLRAGGAGFSAGPLYSWGTSMGATAAVNVPTRYGHFSAIVADSPPCRLLWEWEDSEDVLLHLFGGPPTDPVAGPRYRAAACDTLVEDRVLQLPIFVPWNQQDQMVPPEHPQGLIQALSENYPLEGDVYGSQDFNHPFPVPQYHVQSRMNTPPGGYFTGILMDFLEGKEVWWQEAEGQSGTCGTSRCLGGVLSGDSTAAYSQSAAWDVDRGQNGPFAEQSVPSSLAPGVEVDATLLLAAADSDLVPDDQAVLIATYSEGGEPLSTVTLVAGQFFYLPPGTPPTVASNAVMVNQFRNTHLHFTPIDPSRGVLTLTTTGALHLDLDAIAFLQRH